MNERANPFQFINKHKYKMKNMKAAIYSGKESIEIRDLPTPVCGDNDVLIKYTQASAERMSPYSEMAPAPGSGSTLAANSVTKPSPAWRLSAGM